jgi:hypothetical protein
MQLPAPDGTTKSQRRRALTASLVIAALLILLHVTNLFGL